MQNCRNSYEVVKIYSCNFGDFCFYLLVELFAVNKGQIFVFPMQVTRGNTPLVTN